MTKTKQIQQRVIHVRADKSYTRERAARAAARAAQEKGQDWVVGWTGDIEEHEGRFFPILEQVEKIEVEVERAKARSKGADESPVAAVWVIAYMLAGEKRRTVIARCCEAGVNYHTARTQYQRWFQANRANSAA